MSVITKYSNYLTFEELLSSLESGKYTFVKCFTSFEYRAFAKCWVFRGNLNELSNSFLFEIDDVETVKRIKKVFKKLNCNTKNYNNYFYFKTNY